MRVIIAAITLLLAAGAGAAPKTAKKPPDLMTTLRAQAREALRDPESARFSDEFLHEVPEQNVTALCGAVNSKNAYGGFTGKGGYIVTTSGLLIFQEDVPRGSFGNVWDVWCR